jgi:osmotically inducible lipoprotein OsmB
MYASQQTASSDSHIVTMLNQQIAKFLNLICQVQQLGKTYSRKRNLMNTIRTLTVNLGVLALLTGLAGCAGMSARDQNTAVGAGIGAIGGAILTDGNPIGTIGGAAVGGVIGNQVRP